MAATWCGRSAISACAATTSTRPLNATGADTTNLQSAVYSLGIDVRSAGTVGAVLSLEYHIQDELQGFAAPLDNDRFVARLLARF